MYKCLIVGNLRDISRNYNLLYSFHKSNDIEIVGMATNSKFHKKLYGVPHINIENLDEVSFDYAIVVYEYINQYKETIKYLLSNYKNIKIIKYEVFQLPFFDINKYIKLINNPPTIFSNNCNGGVLSNTLGLEFKSPLVNLYIDDADYIKFLKNPQKYINSNILPYDYEVDSKGKRYPLCKCDDIILHCMHYETHDDVIATWNRRKQRINFDNLIVIYASLKKEYIEEFLTLPYKNKICISPYDYEDECSYKVDLLGILREEWYSSTLGIFNYNFPLYDLLDMVCDNKKTYLGDITNKE